MKAVILAGGLGTRIMEETHLRPKPMIEIGGLPILWHIMKTYSNSGFNDFIICLGYKGYMIKQYFVNYKNNYSNITVDLNKNHIEVSDEVSEKWKIELIDTGKNSMTGSRIKKIQKYIGDKDFMLTYGDCVTNLDINKVVEFHRLNNKILTITAAQPKARWGALDIKDGIVHSFKEKPKGDGNWINGGYMVCNNKIFDYLSENDNCVFEQGPMDKIAEDGQMAAYQHHDFWHPMDTLKDKIDLNNMWDSGNAPWKK